MVEFMSSYAPSMDRFEERPVAPMEQVTADIEAPIIPVGELGTTFIDQGNVLQNLENSIRMGAKKLQLVMSGNVQGVPSHGASTWGKDVRKALYEKTKATGVEITGVELSPQTMQGMSGIDQRSGRITEEGRQQSLNAVRDAVRFVADVAKGGGIDVYSQEFNRDILDASWNKDKQFYDYSQAELDPNNTEARRSIVKYLIDKRTGEPIRDSVIRKDEQTTEIRYTTARDMGLAGKRDPKGNVLGENDYVDLFGNKLRQDDPEFYSKRVPLMNEKGEFQIRQVDWSTVEKERDEYYKLHQERLKAAGIDHLTTEEYLYRQKLEANQTLVRGQTLHYSHNIDIMRAQLRELNELKGVAAELQGTMSKDQQRAWARDVLFSQLPVGRLPESERERLLKEKDPVAIVDTFIQREENELRGAQETALSYRLQEAEIEERKGNIMTPEKYAKSKVFDSYSEAGIDAMNVTRERKLAKPIYIGPEIGMASEMYGGHPKEFIELIQKSREEMANKLMRNKGMDKEAADEAAKTHIKGMMDTSHMMMWYKHFARKPGETDEKHIKRFNGWLIDQTRDMVKAGVVGGVQVVDTITGEHAHLPAGQGAFDVVGMVKAMKEEGFKGDIVSEGHGEESLGQGRILTETWRAFGAPIGNYAPGKPMGLRSWGGMQGSYFGRTNPTTYIAGAYVPSNEWQLWSETPFE